MAVLAGFSGSSWADDMCTHDQYRSYEVPATELSYTIEGLEPGEHELTAYTEDTDETFSPASEPYRFIASNSSATARWARPQTRIDGTPLPPEEIQSYRLYHQFSVEMPCDEVTRTATSSGSSTGASDVPDQEEQGETANSAVAGAAAVMAGLVRPEVEEGDCLPGIPCANEDADPSIGDEVTQEGENGGVERTEITLGDFFPPVTDSTCLNYCFKGICLWLQCGPFGCSVETSPRVAHRNPDAVVSVYQEPGENPWREIRMIYGALQKATLDASIALWRIRDNDEAGSADQISRQRQTRPLIYREADAFGYPYYFGLINDELFCRTKSLPFMPIFQSAFDNFNWRIALGEYIYVHKLLPGVEHVGTFMLDNWGKVYRRYGFIGQLNEPAANAVIAQRVGSIISESLQPHLYYPIEGAPTASGQKFFLEPEPLVAGEDEGGVWQMLAPVKDEQCYIFAEDEDQKEWAEGRESEDKASIFTLWRPYECCKDKGSYVTTLPAEVCL